MNNDHRNSLSLRNSKIRTGADLKVRKKGTKPHLELLRLTGLIVLLCLLPYSLHAQGTRVTFDTNGIVQVNGKPFFPVGIWLYDMTGSVLADIHEQQFNTVILHSSDIHRDQLKTLEDHGLMAICQVSDEWFPAAKSSPVLLSWYLSDEPEGHGGTPADLRAQYLQRKQVDPDHPFGLDHFLFEALDKYKDACDYTMTDVYPITRNRDVPITHVGLFMDQARKVHQNPNWPHWTFIQVFGGPDTEGGKWAQPLPHEVRCMTYIALAHRANGILYFSYWPKAPQTWASLGALNREIHRMTPWLVAPGEEREARSSDAAVQVRARQVRKGGILIAVNTGPAFTDTDVTVPGLNAKRLRRLFRPGELPCSGGRLKDAFGPFEERVYIWGDEPDVELAARK
jgi:hypothetical protein